MATQFRQPGNKRDYNGDFSERSILIHAISYFRVLSNINWVTGIFPNIKDAVKLNQIESIMISSDLFECSNTNGIRYNFKIRPDVYYQVSSTSAEAFIDAWNQLNHEKHKERELTSKKLRLDTSNAERIYRTYNTTRVITWVTFFISIILALLKIAESLKIWPYHK